MTAYYKGYSTQGDDLETIKEKIITVNAQIQRTEDQLATLDFQ